MCAGCRSLQHAHCLRVAWSCLTQVDDPQTHQGRMLALVRSYLLPQGFPDSVAPQYASYMGWRGVQYFFGGAMSVFTTKCLLTSLGVAGRHSVSSTPTRPAPPAAGCPADATAHCHHACLPSCCTAHTPDMLQHRRLPATKVFKLHVIPTLFVSCRVRLLLRSTGCSRTVLGGWAASCLRAGAVSWTVSSSSSGWLETC